MRQNRHPVEAVLSLKIPKWISVGTWEVGRKGRDWHSRKEQGVGDKSEKTEKNQNMPHLCKNDHEANFKGLNLQEISRPVAFGTHTKRTWCVVLCKAGKATSPAVMAADLNKKAFLASTSTAAAVCAFP